ncbi:hypothetical protein D9757_004372 [Collybiopsis confluens]|uniref:Tyrosine specific protein phosphatases domain-containing protein n=1 Tax=Collybiopsis confluens TaxID=2823264 RepID=A0A8H5HTW3_9AGAR|nr:hypothetical protein D9757_004372 [Collybiopsis confluens]
MLTHNTPPDGNSNEAVITAVEQIARLASQHHVSEYSRLKYGPSGHPGKYIPLSLRAPQAFQELREKQAECSIAQTWWLSEKPTGKNPPILLGPSGASDAASLVSDGLARQLSAALDEQLPQTATNESPIRQLSNGSQIHIIKTSASHPINISAIIPHEILHLLSSHLMFVASTVSLDTIPIVFEISDPFTLDRFILSQSTLPRSSRIPTPALPPEPLNPLVCTRSHVTEALQAAINSGIKSFTTLVEYEAEPAASFPSSKTDPVSGPLADSMSTTGSFDLEPVDLPSEATSESGPPTNAELQAEAQLPSIEAVIPQSPNTAPSFVLGNLFLSSCPGKKVRLEGPVQGRSGLRRDLPTDLQRMKDLGVGCVVCCLDDTELSFLGAPWPEYQAATSKIGLDVLRLPTPEGLAPSLSPGLLDKELSILIQNYTLRGIPVLVHCRAGVISACWVLKLGLCGWLSDKPSPVASPSDLLSNSTEFNIRQDALELLEKVIAVVRRRRSVKAIETFEQAQFLLDFIEYLRSLQTT